MGQLYNTPTKTIYQIYYKLRILVTAEAIHTLLYASIRLLNRSTLTLWRNVYLFLG